MELLVVIAILGVLSSVAVPNVTQFIGRGRTEAGNAEKAMMQAAVATYMIENDGDLPTADGNAGVITAATINSYIIGGLAAVSYGVYSVTDDGEVETTFVP